jgi:MerR family transcriptional regulator, light-induced transcriptional regulator
MGKFSIKDLEQLTGIKAHTLRIWEQRYNFIKPQRTETNIRHYCDEDLKLILNISLLKDRGYKISKLADMSPEDLKAEVAQVTEKVLEFPDQISALTLAMIDIDEDRFERIMSNNILRHGFEKTMVNIIYPFLNRVGILWQTGSINPAQEHFITNLIRQKIIVAIDGFTGKRKDDARKFLLFLPEGELHEISLLFAWYLAKSAGHKVVYLGQSLPFIDLQEVYKTHEPEFIFTILTYVPEESTQAYMDKLSGTFPNCKILITGYQVVGNEFRSNANVRILHNFHEFINLLKTT